MTRVGTGKTLDAVVEVELAVVAGKLLDGSPEPVAVGVRLAVV